jgi:hypothetical protein
VQTALILTLSSGGVVFGDVQQAVPDELTVRQVIGSLQSFTPQEREAAIVWLLAAIEQQPNPHVRTQLGQLFIETMARVSQHDQGISVALQFQATPQMLQEQQSVERLHATPQALSLPEDEIRKRIEALTLDPKAPEGALNQAMELARFIEQLDDQRQRETLQKFLEDRLIALQGDLEES